MIRCNSSIQLDMNAINILCGAQVAALKQTAEALHTEVVQAQVMPFDDPEVIEKIVYGKRGQFAKNGREYKGKVVKEVAHRGGNLQNNSTFIDSSDANNGSISIISSTPYARRLYFHPEYHFDKGENPNAKGKWFDDWLPGGKYEDFARKTFHELYRRITGL